MMFLDQIPVLADLQRFMDELAIVSRRPGRLAVRDRVLHDLAAMASS